MGGQRVGPNPSGLCMCGCGEGTRQAPRTNGRFGLVKGQPIRYVLNHQTRKSPVAYVEEDRGHDTPCWIWRLSTHRRGYGQIRIAGKLVGTHRHYYERKHGPIPDGFQIDHLCRVRNCVNPDHMEPVTQVENVRRGINVKLDIGKARGVRNLAAVGLSYPMVAEMYGVAEQTVGSVVRGEHWKESA